MSSQPYRLVELDIFTDSLRRHFRRSEKRIREKIQQMLESRPERYGMFQGPITVSGVKLIGLRHMKIGVKGLRGGAVVLYRICEECLRDLYYIKSNTKCQFCRDDEPHKVVLFDTYPRGRGYR